MSCFIDMMMVASMATCILTQVAACNALIDCGANVNQGAVNGVTPLHLAAYFGLKDILNLLLRKGAILGSKDVQGRSAIHYGTIPDSTTCLQILLRNAYDSLINASDDSYLTALHWAISRDHYQHMLVLIKRYVHT
jgi:ankyrin repeat protein